MDYSSVSTNTWCDRIINDEVGFEGDKNDEFQKNMKKVIKCQIIVSKQIKYINEEIRKDRVDLDKTIYLVERILQFIEKAQENIDNLKDIAKLLNMDIKDFTYLKVCGHNKDTFDFYTKMLKSLKNNL